MKPLPDLNRLNEMLAYDQNTGLFTWDVSRGGKHAGSLAGTLNDRGYREIMIDGVRYKAHRIAWKMMTGSDPAKTIDHINNIRDDNRFPNLREATQQQQCANTTRSGGSSDHLGVCWHKKLNKWVAHIRINGKKRHLGIFSCEIEAARAYDVAAAKHHGEFANLNSAAHNG